MEARNLNIYFFFLMLLVVAGVVFFIFQPFLTAIVAAAILAALFKPTYEFFQVRMRAHRGLASFATCVVVALIIVAPILFVLSLAIGEANHLYETMSREVTFTSLVDQSVKKLNEAPYLHLLFNEQTLNTERVMVDIRRFGENALGLLQAAYQSVTHFIFWVFVMFFTLYYFLMDGKNALAGGMRLSPLKNEHEKLLIAKFVSMSRATLKGTLVVGVVQGLLGGIAFWIVGIPSPSIWGLFMILLSIIPLIGSAIVWLPAGLMLLFLGQIWQGVFLLIVGFGVISLIDNILRPKLVGKDTQMHPLTVFFATLGGITLFGLPGFIIGPIIVSLFVALWEIYAIEFKGQLSEFNASS